ncbi:hypothetical protein DB346_04550 [Verrucomicrobia bacterium LW23]|nr:hypothetical protein DB346_04550 [Verrucomicrobia bacterium LW23]
MTSANPLPPPRFEELWSWSEDGEAIVWADGATIAFELEISVLLSEMAARGRAPRFGALVLLLAATRGKVPHAGSLDVIIGWRKGSPAPDAPPHAVKSHQQKEMLRERLQAVLDNLARLAPAGPGRPVGGIPRELLADRRGRSVLCEAVFELTPDALLEGGGSPASSSAASASAPDPDITAAGQLLQRLGPGGAGGEASAASYLKDLQALEPGLAALDPSSLPLRLKTGLDALPAAAEIDIPPARQALELLSELERDPEYAGLGKVVRDIMAALYLDRPPLASRDTQAVGGISDIANKGQLHRLLLSELANDDLVLSVRLAMNEALFLCPDPPALSPPHAMAVLLDSGIRMWGVPRVFAVAVALAWIGRQCGGKGQALGVYRAERDGVVRVQFLARAGLEQHLGALEVTEHPGGALPAFLEEAAKLADAQPEGSPAEPDLFIISHTNALRDKDFLAALTAAGPASVHLAGVDRDGRFALDRWTPLGRALVTEAVIELDALFDMPLPSGNRPAPPRLADPREDRLPEFLVVQPPPLLLPVSTMVDRVLERHGGAGAAVTTDGRVWLWDGSGLGGREVSPGRLRGRLVWVGWSNPPGNAAAVSDPANAPGPAPTATPGPSPHNYGRMLIVHHRAPPGTLTLATVDTSRRPATLEEKVLMTTEHLGSVWLEAGILYVHVGSSVHLFDTEGREVATLQLPAQTYPMQAFPSNGGWFLQAAKLCYVHWDGRVARLQSVPGVIVGGTGPQAVVLAFSTEGVRGPRLLQRNGCIVNHGDGSVVRLAQYDTITGKEQHTVHISPDGKALCVTPAGNYGQSWRYNLSYPDRPARIYRKVGAVHDVWWDQATFPAWSLRKRITHIGPLPGGGLMLRTSKGQYLHLEVPVANVGPNTPLVLRERAASGTASPAGAKSAADSPAQGAAAESGLPNLLVAESGPFVRTFRPYVYKEDVSYTLSVATWEDGSKAWLDSRGLIHLQPARTDLVEITVVLAERPGAWTSDGHLCGPVFFTGAKLGAPAPAAPVWAAIQAFSHELR